MRLIYFQLILIVVFGLVSIAVAKDELTNSDWEDEERQNCRYDLWEVVDYAGPLKYRYYATDENFMFYSDGNRHDLDQQPEEIDDDKWTYLLQGEFEQSDIESLSASEQETCEERTVDPRLKYRLTVSVKEVKGELFRDDSGKTGVIKHSKSAEGGPVVGGCVACIPAPALASCLNISIDQAFNNVPNFYYSGFQYGLTFQEDLANYLRFYGDNAEANSDCLNNVEKTLGLKWMRNMLDVSDSLDIVDIGLFEALPRMSLSFTTEDDLIDILGEFSSQSQLLEGKSILEVLEETRKQVRGNCSMINTFQPNHVSDFKNFLVEECKKDRLMEDKLFYDK